MQSQEFWLAVNAASDMFEAQPVVGTFEAWVAQTWPEYEKMCAQVAKHYYVMCVAHRQYQHEAPVAFVDEVERERLAALCREVGLEPREFVTSAFTRHKNACLK